MNKVELEAKLESLTDEINFLRQIFEEVNIIILMLFQCCFNVFSMFFITFHVLVL